MLHPSDHRTSRPWPYSMSLPWPARITSDPVPWQSCGRSRTNSATDFAGTNRRRRQRRIKLSRLLALLRITPEETVLLPLRPRSSVRHRHHQGAIDVLELALGRLVDRLG